MNRVKKRSAPRTSGARAYPWRGFERAPEGCLFEQHVDLDRPMGVAYERSLRFEKEMHVHERLLLVFPREGTSMRVSTERQQFTITDGDVLAVPAGLLHDDHWITDVYDTFALLPSTAVIEASAKKVGADARVLDRPLLFKRSTWLQALLAEYFADRVLRSVPDGPRHAALEELLLIEVLRLAGESDDVPLPARPGPSSTIARALRYLEGQLFSEVDLEDLCRACAASRSSLLRHFRRELGTTPKAYLTGRRLEEARRLLGDGRYRVGEVGRLVGYKNQGAFTEAFRRRFGVVPSDA